MDIFIVFTIPEIFLTIGIFTILLFSLFLDKKSINFSLNSSIFLVIFVIILLLINKNFNLLNYNQLFLNNAFINLFKILILISCLFFLFISENYFKDHKLENFEIPILALFSILGMMIMISSNNLMTMYLGIELQSLSLYVVATIQKYSLKSSEAGLKYFILGALSSGIFLYGCSLIYGFTGTTDFLIIKESLKNHETLNLGLTFALVFILVSLAFKVSAVPFHMWTPDVYEGSPTPITAFFSIVPKIAAIGILIRFLYEPFGEYIIEWRQILIFISILSMILGSLAAIMQNNIKRLLAYSTIGHIGYIMIGIATGSKLGIEAVIIYICIYVMMNAAIFSLLLSIKSKNNKYIEEISEFAGMSKRYPIISLLITIMMFSMVGVPPFAGFFGKFYIFSAAFKSDLIILAIIGVLTSVISAFYYIRIIKHMYFDDSIDEYNLIINYKNKFVLIITSVFITFFIVYPSPLINLSAIASNSLL